MLVASRVFGIPVCLKNRTLQQIILHKSTLFKPEYILVTHAHCRYKVTSWCIESELEFLRFCNFVPKGEGMVGVDLCEVTGEWFVMCSSDGWSDSA